jgi:hypothetical protein
MAGLGGPQTTSGNATLGSNDATILKIARTLGVGTSVVQRVVLETAFDCRRVVQILSMNHCVGCWWRSCHDVAPLGYFERSSKTFKT